MSTLQLELPFPPNAPCKYAAWVDLDGELVDDDLAAPFHSFEGARLRLYQIFDIATSRFEDGTVVQITRWDEIDISFTAYVKQPGRTAQVLRGAIASVPA